MSEALSGRCERSVVRSSVIPSAEIVLLLVAAQVLERQYDDGKMRRVGELIVNGGGQETPPARSPACQSKGPRRKKRKRELPAARAGQRAQTPRVLVAAWGDFRGAGAPWRRRYLRTGSAMFLRL